MRVQLIKNGLITKQMFDIVSVHSDKKYGYFVVTQKTLHHQIITIHRFSDVDYVVLVNRDGTRKEIHQ